MRIKLRIESGPPMPPDGQGTREFAVLSSFPSQLWDRRGLCRLLSTTRTWDVMVISSDSLRKSTWWLASGQKEARYILAFCSRLQSYEWEKLWSLGLNLHYLRYGTSALDPPVYCLTACSAPPSSLRLGSTASQRSAAAPWMSAAIGVARYGALGHVPPRLTTINFFSAVWPVQSLTATICRQLPPVKTK